MLRKVWEDKVVTKVMITTRGWPCSSLLMKLKRAVLIPHEVNSGWMADWCEQFGEYEGRQWLEKKTKDCRYAFVLLRMFLYHVILRLCEF